MGMVMWYFLFYIIFLKYLCFAFIHQTAAVNYIDWFHTANTTSHSSSLWRLTDPRFYWDKVKHHNSWKLWLFGGAFLLHLKEHWMCPMCQIISTNKRSVNWRFQSIMICKSFQNRSKYFYAFFFLKWMYICFGAWILKLKHFNLSRSKLEAWVICLCTVSQNTQSTDNLKNQETNCTVHFTCQSSFKSVSYFSKKAEHYIFLLLYWGVGAFFALPLIPMVLSSVSQCCHCIQEYCTTDFRAKL